MVILELIKDSKLFIFHDMYVVNVKTRVCVCMCLCVYLLSEQSTGQTATAVAESPTSKIEEQGLISRGKESSSNLHGPHTIT